MFRKLILAGAVLALATIVIPKASASDVFQLNVDYCSQLCFPLGGSGGTVTVTGNNTQSVTIVVALTSPLTFHQTSGLDAFMFNATSAGAFTVANAAGSGFTLCAYPCSTHEDGAGTFLIIDCLSGAPQCPQQNGGPNTGLTTLTITLTSTSSHNINVETTNGGASNVDFAADVTNGTCTGLIGGGSGAGASNPFPTTNPGSTVCSTNTSVPEPTSVLLLGTGLLFAGKFLKAKLLVG